MRSAFTLAEIVMVSVVLGLIVGSLAQIVRAARGTALGVQHHLDVSAHVRLAQETLRRDLAGVLQVQPTAFSYVPPQSSSVSDGILGFVTVRPVDPVRGGCDSDVTYVEYRLREVADGTGPHWLVRHARPLRPFQPIPEADRRSDGDPAAFTPVARHVVRLDLRFFDGANWRISWRKDSGVPRLVQVRLEASLAPGGPLIVPLTVALPTTIAPGDRP